MRFALPLAIFASLSAAAIGLATGASAQTGGASFYVHGRQTANGERFNPGGMTAAHRSLPFNTRVRVTDAATGRAITVRINDRGPFVGGRIIDLAGGAARALGIVQRGHARVHIAVVGRQSILIYDAGAGIMPRPRVERPRDPRTYPP